MAPSGPPSPRESAARPPWGRGSPPGTTSLLLLPPPRAPGWDRVTAQASAGLGPGLGVKEASG